MTIHQIALVAPDWQLEDHEYDEPTYYDAAFEGDRKPWADASAALAWLADTRQVRPVASFPDAGILYVVPENYRHCRMCGMHGADDGAWADATEEENRCDDGQPDPYGGICPECQ